MRGRLDQVQQWEQENPDQVDHVPVQAAQINWREVLRAEITTHATQEEPCDHDHANDDVGPVQAGHGVVDTEVEVGVGGTLGIHAGIRVVGVVVMPPVIRIMSMVSMGMVFVITMIIMIIMVVVIMSFGLLGIEQCQTAGRQPARARWSS